jgi:hypothetical protein
MPLADGAKQAHNAERICGKQLSNGEKMLAVIAVLALGAGIILAACFWIGLATGDRSGRFSQRR